MSFINNLDSMRIEFIYDAAAHCFYLISCVLLAQMCFKTRLKSLRWILLVLPIIALFSALDAYRTVYEIDNYRTLFDLVLISLPFAEMLIVFKKPPVRKHLATFLANCLIRALLKSAILPYFLPKMEGRRIMLVTDFLLFAVSIGLYVVIYNKRNTSEKLSYLNAWTFIWICITVTCFGTTFVVLIDNGFKYSGLLIVDIVLFCSLIPYVINSMLKAKQSETYFRRALDAEVRHFEMLNEKDMDLRRFRHDYVNHMRAISAMAEDGNTQAIQEYVEKLGVELNSTARDFNTGNYMLDIILAEKRSVAKQDGNDILFEGRFPKIGISNDDICTIMANALDNAIEACRGAEECCDIRVKSITKIDEVAVSIVNPVHHKVRVIGAGIITSKSDRSRHGFGLKSIKKTVAKYDGSMHPSADDKTFELFLILKLSSQSEDSANKLK